MSVGKYSPTVSSSYAADRDWFRKVADDTDHDPAGYDSYGYHKDTDEDRAGYTENDYLTDYDTDTEEYTTYEAVFAHWRNRIITFPQ